MGGEMIMQLQVPSEKEIREAYHEGEDVVVQLFHNLTNTISVLIAHVQKQDELIKALQGQIAKNSSNSSKPPSSDGYKKSVQPV